MTPEERAEAIAKIMTDLSFSRKARVRMCVLEVRAAEAAARADGWRKGAEAMREAAATFAEQWEPQKGWKGWYADYVPERLGSDLRHMPLPEPPAEKGE